MLQDMHRLSWDKSSTSGDCVDRISFSSVLFPFQKKRKTGSWPLCLPCDKLMFRMTSLHKLMLFGEGQSLGRCCLICEKKARVNNNKKKKIWWRSLFHVIVSRASDENVVLSNQLNFSSHLQAVIFSKLQPVCVTVHLCWQTLQWCHKVT